MPDFLDGIEEFLESFSPEDVAVMRAVFRRLVDGRATPPAMLPDILGMPRAAVEAALVRLVGHGTIVLDPETGEVVGARGLSLAETPHRVVVDGRQLYAFCAVDAVGIPVALGLDALVESHCYACGTPLALSITKGVVTEASDGMVIWAAARDLSRSLRDYT